MKRRFVEQTLKSMNLKNANTKKEVVKSLNKYGYDLYFCSVCGKFMISGYTYEEIGMYYCSQDCLELNYNIDDIQELFECELIKII